VGGDGDDIYIVNATTDVETESGTGLDTVLSAVTWTLGSNLENLTLTGTSAVNGTGNSLNNWLIGNSAADSLSGDAGDDVLDCGAGSDTLAGGLGADTYLLSGGGGTCPSEPARGFWEPLSVVCLGA
jgi:serralysin